MLYLRASRSYVSPQAFQMWPCLSDLGKFVGAVDLVKGEVWFLFDVDRDFAQGLSIYDCDNDQRRKQQDDKQENGYGRQG